MNIIILMAIIFFAYGGYVAHKKIKQFETDSSENLDENDEYKKFKNARKIAVAFCLIGIFYFFTSDSADEREIKEHIVNSSKTIIDGKENELDYELIFDDIKIDDKNAVVDWTLKIKLKKSNEQHFMKSRDIFSKINGKWEFKDAYVIEKK